MFRKPYVFNIVNAILIVIATIYFIYYCGPAVDNLIEDYKKNSHNFEIFKYIWHLKILIIIVITSFIFLNLSVISSNILWKVKGIEKSIPFLFLFLNIAIPIIQIYKYFYIKYNAFNYKGFSFRIFYSFYYEYIIMNFIILLLISYLCIYNQEKNINRIKVAFFINVLLSILIFSMSAKFLYYFSDNRMFFLIFLVFANVLCAFVEYKEGKKQDINLK